MAENEKVENQNPSVSDAKSSDDAKSVEGDYNTYKSDIDSIEENKTNNTIKTTIEKVSEEIANRKWEKFKESHPDIEATSPKELKGELLTEYEAYQLEQGDVKDIFEKARKDILDITIGRQNKLEELGGNKAKGVAGKVKKLEDNVKEKLEEVEKKIAELENAEQTEETKKELENLNEQKNKLEGLQQKIGSQDEKDKDKKKGTLYGDLGLAFSNQKLVKENAYNQLADAFSKDVKDGRDFVLNDQKLKDALLTVEKAEKEVEQAVEENPTQAQQIDPRMAAAAAQQAAKAAGVPNMGAVEAANVVENAEQEEIKPDYLGILGYNAGNVLNPKSSMALLDVYVGKNITDEDRLAMLNDPETRDVIFEAMNKANNSLNPLNRIKFNKTRARLVQLAKGEMVRKAVESLGEKHPENVEESFNKAKNEYNSLRKDIQDKMKGEITEEQKAELQTQLNELDKKYESINNVEMFRNNAKDLERFRDRAAEKISNMLGKNDTLSLPAEKSNNEVKEVEQPKVTDSHEEVDFRSNLSGMNQDRNEVAKTDVENLAKNNQTLTQEQRKNAEKVLNSNDKSL